MENWNKDSKKNLVKALLDAKNMVDDDNKLVLFAIPSLEVGEVVETKVEFEIQINTIKANETGVNWTRFDLPLDCNGIIELVTITNESLLTNLKDGQTLYVGCRKNPKNLDFKQLVLVGKKHYEEYQARFKAETELLEEIAQ